MKVPDGVTELYYINYLYGFLSSGLVYTLLHIVFPAREVDAFVKESPSAREVQRHYQDRWEVELSQTAHVLDDSSSHEMSIEKEGRHSAMVF